jgi:hypothetical protein
VTAHLDALRVIALLVCLVLTGAAVLLPEHGWLQLLASASCAGFAWAFGTPPGVLLAGMLARMRPAQLANVLTQAAASMPPERAAELVASLRPPPASGYVPIPPVPVVFAGESEPPANDGATDGWEAPAVSETPAERPMSRKR